MQAHTHAYRFPNPSPRTPEPSSLPRLQVGVHGLRHEVPDQGPHAEDSEPRVSEFAQGVNASRLDVDGEEGGEVAAVGRRQDRRVHPHERHEDLDADVPREERLGDPEVDADDVHARVTESLTQRLAPAEETLLLLDLYLLYIYKGSGVGGQHFYRGNLERLEGNYIFPMLIFQYMGFSCDMQIDK